MDRLGAGPCYHMSDVMRDPARARAWLAATASGNPDWGSLFAGFASTMDWPASAFWRELLEAYPEAKAILTVRDPEQWYESMDKTILRSWRERAQRLSQPADQRTETAQTRVTDTSDFFELTQSVVNGRVFDGRAAERDHAIATFERHNAEVVATVPADRLLVYEVSQGWKPLCEFLDVAVPDEPFPRENDAATFSQRAGFRQ
jgi:hypothetical protein